MTTSVTKATPMDQRMDAKKLIYLWHASFRSRIPAIRMHAIAPGSCHVTMAKLTVFVKEQLHWFGEAAAKNVFRGQES